MAKITEELAERLNLSMPIANEVKLGDTLKELQEGSGGESSVSWDAITGKPTAFPPVVTVKVNNAGHADTAGSATTATTAQSANSVIWGNVQNKPSIPTATSALLSSVSAIGDPASATAEDIATKINEVLTALKA